MNRESADAYIKDGCGRCELYRTVDCKVLLWTDALEALREILLETELKEEMKWGVPCYTLDGKNVLMMTSFRRSCALSFFKGAAFDDPEGPRKRPSCPPTGHLRSIRHWPHHKRKRNFCRRPHRWNPPYSSGWRGTTSSGHSLPTHLGSPGRTKRKEDREG